MHLFPLLPLSLLIITVLGHVLPHNDPKQKIRTVVTTDMESDDLASLVRYILYTNDLDNQGLIYTSSRFHWEGDGKGTKFFLPGREYNTSQTSWRPTGTTTIEEHLLKAYEEVYPNLKVHDSTYPTPEHLLSITKIGNVDFEGEMSKDTDGSNLIKKLLLDDSDSRTLYLQAWGGTNTIARALKSIEEDHTSSNPSKWNKTKSHISAKTVLLASGFQDETYEEYIAPNWPSLRVEELSKAYATWGFNCNSSGQGNIRGLPDNNIYYQGEWVKSHIQIGPLGSLYRSWLDGQTTFGGGDQLDVYGDPEKAGDGWCKPMEKYDFLSEGDNVVFNGLIPTGLERPVDANLGSWGGRRKLNSSNPEVWVLVDEEVNTKNDSLVDGWTTGRWVEAAQNDFAARISWSLTGKYEEGNHPPHVKVVGRKTLEAKPGEMLEVKAKTSDPDGDKVAVTWWQYLEEGTYPGTVNITKAGKCGATIHIPQNAKPGQTISIIVQGTDNGVGVPLTRYGRLSIDVI